MPDLPPNAEGTATIREPTELRPFANLPFAALDDLAARARWLDTLPPELRERCERSLTTADELAARTEWRTSRLLKWLGCQLATEPEEHELFAEDLDHCQLFLELVSRGMDCVDRPLDRRFVAKAFKLLLFHASAERDARMTRFKRDAQWVEEASVLTEVVEDALDKSKAWKYLALGEIDAAERVARAHLSGTAQAADPATNPFDARPTIHISTPRLEAYVRGDRDALGPGVYAKIEQHLEGCRACDAARNSLQ